MYLTYSFIVQIIAALVILFYVSFVQVGRGLLNKFVFKFVPLVVAFALLLNAFNVVK